MNKTLQTALDIRQIVTDEFTLLHQPLTDDSRRGDHRNAVHTAAWLLRQYDALDHAPQILGRDREQALCLATIAADRARTDHYFRFKARRCLTMLRKRIAAREAAAGHISPGRGW